MRQCEHSNENECVVEFNKLFCCLSQLFFYILQHFFPTTKQWRKKCQHNSFVRVLISLTTFFTHSSSRWFIAKENLCIFFGVCPIRTQREWKTYEIKIFLIEKLSSPPPQHNIVIILNFIEKLTVKQVIHDDTLNFFALKDYRSVHSYNRSSNSFKV